MTTLHQKLIDIVSARMHVAILARNAWGSIDSGSDGIPFVVVDEILDFIDENNPTVIIRMCERDLNTLNLHRPVDTGNNVYCMGPHALRRIVDCPDIKYLATAYGIDGTLE